MFGECHAHIIMDGQNYKRAIALHEERINEEIIRIRLQEYRKRGIKFIRDGGDALGVSKKPEN